MSEIKEEKRFHFTFKVFLRLLIFILILYFAINYFSSNKNSSPILGDTTTLIDETDANQFLNNLYQNLPENSRYQIENFNKTPTGKFIQEKTIFIKEQSNGFPDKQIKEFKKSLIKQISNDLIEGIDNNN